VLNILLASHILASLNGGHAARRLRGRDTCGGDPRGVHLIELRSATAKTEEVPAVPTIPEGIRVPREAVREAPVPLADIHLRWGSQGRSPH
jgi:hypothetical protein